MPRRTSSRAVSFRHPFSLKGVEGHLPPGTYTVETDEDLVEELSFLAWRRVATTIRVPIGHGGSSYEMISVEPAALEEAERRDRTGDLPG